MAVSGKLFYTISLFIQINLILNVKTSKTESLTEYKYNTVLIAILVRNKAHTLPYFLTYLERLDYPKDRISLLITSDHNEDNSIEVLTKWLSVHRDYYHSVEFNFDAKNKRLEGEEGPAHWPSSRYSHIISLRESALKKGRHKWADYLWELDCDVFLTNPKTLRQLIDTGYTIVAPLLRSDGLYSNFWCGMTEDFYYQRTKEYSQILNGHMKGCHRVPMVHSSVLIDLRVLKTDMLTYVPENLNIKGPHDDIITFALSANISGIPMYVCNDELYGYVMVPLESEDIVTYDLLQLKNLKLEVLVDNPPLEASEFLKPYIQQPHEVPLDIEKVFMINLKRRPDRRVRMMNSLNELKIEAQVIDAVDGQLLTDEELDKLGVKLMPGYYDPFHMRPMKRGEIGCFLSHYNIWKETVRQNYNMVMVLEDDVRFEPFFNQKMHGLLREIKKLPFEWDLIYLGRKRLEENVEDSVEGSKLLVWASYSYWTIGYLLSGSGAAKLIRQDPLSNILPVDEYLPILYDKHPEDQWKAFYPIRDLVALSSQPLVIYPARYLHEEGYVSDTEDSPTVTTTPNPEL